VPPTRTQRRLLIAALLAALAVFAVACSSSSTTTTGSGSPGSTPTGSSAGNVPEKITIAYQEVPNGDLIVKHEGWLEKELPNVKIEWKKFDSGGDVNEAIAANAVDFGLAGSSPVSRGLSQPLPYQVPWIFDVIGKAEALVVKGDKGINSLADLKGKTIATPFASTSHYSLLAALKDANVPETDVKIIDATPGDIYAAWTRGDIDGAYVWNPNLAKMKSEGGKILVDSEQLSKKGKTTYDLAVVTNSFASKYPNVVTTWAKQQDKAVQLIKSDPTKAATAVGAELNLSADDAKAQLADLIFLTAKEQVGKDYLGGGLADNLIAAAAFNKALGKIDQVQPDDTYRKAVVTTFAQGASGA